MIFFFFFLWIVKQQIIYHKTILVLNNYYWFDKKKYLFIVRPQVLSILNCFIIICQMSFRNLRSRLFYLWKSSILAILLIFVILITINYCGSQQIMKFFQNLSGKLFNETIWLQWFSHSGIFYCFVVHF